MTEAPDSLQAQRAAALARRSAQARERMTAKVIGVTGSSGKSTTTALLAHVLASQGRVLPMVECNYLQSARTAMVRAERGYDFAVIEAGINGAIPEIAETIRPDVAVVTMVALEHKSLFRTVETIAAVKGRLPAAVRHGGFAALNGDDPLVAAMTVPEGARVVRFGRSEGNDYRAVDPRAPFPARLRLDLAWRGGVLPLRTNFIGEHFWLPATAAIAAALELGVPPEAVAERVASFEPLFERCGVAEIPGGPCFIVDTMKAPWHSLKVAFDVLAPVVAPRKRIVLGHISDFYGSNRKYRAAYAMARAAADQVILVGDHRHHARPSQSDLDSGRCHQFATTEQAARYVRESAIAGEVILLKGSVDLHLERIALVFKGDVRCWKLACGKKAGCVPCGEYLPPGAPPFGAPPPAGR